ncbi:MAG: ABC transporter permease, partial [Nitrososphaerales archaeon]
MMGEVVALTVREVKKWGRSKFILFIMLIQPMVWLGLFGKSFNLRGIASLPPDVVAQLPPALRASVADMFNEYLSGIFGGTVDYFSYMAVGMLSVIILFTAMFSGMSVVWDRRLGFLNKLLVAPIPRGSIILAKMSSSVLRGLFQATLVFGIAFLFGLQAGDAFNTLDLLGVFAALFLLSMGLSSIFISISIRVTNWETQMAVANLLNLPLMFASNALFPIKQMPDWLQTVARFNPITYA